MKNIKSLTIIFILTLIFSNQSVSAAVNTIYTLQNKLVPGLNWGYETATKNIDQYQIAHHVIRNVSISRDLDVVLTKTGPNSSGSTASYNMSNGKDRRLTYNQTQDGIFYLSPGKFYLTLRSKIYHIGDTEITKITWQTDDSLN